MNFEQALSKAREGGIIRRRGWGMEFPATLSAIGLTNPPDGDQLDFEWVEPTWCGPHFKGCRAGLEQKDLLADDWEIVGGYCP